MNRQLTIVVVGIIGSFIALTLALFAFDPTIRPVIGPLGAQVPAPVSLGIGLAFWTVLALFSQSLVVDMPRGTKIGAAVIPIIAASLLGGPLAGAFVAFVGVTEKRELTGQIPWYGVMVNHASFGLCALAAGGLYVYVFRSLAGDSLLLDFAGAFIAGFVGASVNSITAAMVASRRLGRSLRGVIAGDFGAYWLASTALVPFAWLFLYLYQGAGAWAVLLASLPLWTIRSSNQRFVEMRETFVQVIRALAGALDARDVYTAGHSHRMSEVAIDIGHEMGLSDDELDQLEYAGALHDIGKIGVPDRVLLKQGRLNDEERVIIEAHPVIGDLIVSPVKRLSTERSLIRHHHERWDGHGYPDGLAGEAIPLLARILAVADSFDAMTAQRPYRMIPLTPAEAYAEIMKCSGSQFDPTVVEFFGRTKWAKGEHDPRRFVDPRLADVNLVSGSARLINDMMADATAGRRQRAVRVEFVDPHGDEARAKAAKALLDAQTPAAAAILNAHGHEVVPPVPVSAPDEPKKSAQA